MKPCGCRGRYKDHKIWAHQHPLCSLHAAAPQLLEACKLAQGCLLGVFQWGPEAYKKLELAIQQAEGGQQ